MTLGRASPRGKSGPRKWRRCSSADPRLKMSSGRMRTTRTSGWAAWKWSSSRSASALCLA